MISFCTFFFFFPFFLFLVNKHSFRRQPLFPPIILSGKYPEHLCATLMILWLLKSRLMYSSRCTAQHRQQPGSPLTLLCTERSWCLQVGLILEQRETTIALSHPLSNELSSVRIAWSEKQRSSVLRRTNIFPLHTHRRISHPWPHTSEYVSICKDTHQIWCGRKECYKSRGKPMFCCHNIWKTFVFVVKYSEKHWKVCEVCKATTVSEDNTSENLTVIWFVSQCHDPAWNKTNYCKLISQTSNCHDCSGRVKLLAECVLRLLILMCRQAWTTDREQWVFCPSVMPAEAACSPPLLPTALPRLGHRAQQMCWERTIMHLGYAQRHTDLSRRLLGFYW